MEAEPKEPTTHQAGNFLEGDVEMPFKTALEIAIRSLTIRFGRSIITASGVLLGIAFLVAVLVGSMIETAQLGEITETARVQQYWLVAMSLLVAGVGIANAMLMSVTERFREIGTMKCLGALDRFIVQMFLLEAVFQGGAGAVAGAVLGFIAGLLGGFFNYGFGETFASLDFLGVLQIFLLSILAGALIAVLAAIYPAFQAARMAPAEAMRTEV